MNQRYFAAAAVLALAVPLCLAFIPWPERSFSGGLELLALNWLYMAAPQLVVVAVGLLSARFRALAALPLVLLALLLLCFQAWVWLVVPSREGSLAWVLYFPLALLVVLLALLGQLAMRNRFKSVP